MWCWFAVGEHRRNKLGNVRCRNTSGMLTVLLSLLLILFLQYYSRGMIVDVQTCRLFLRPLRLCLIFSLYLVNVDISVYMYLMYILVSLMSRYRVFCTKHVNGERSCSYACTCLVTGEMFRLSVFLSALVFYVIGVIVCPHCNNQFHKCTQVFM